MVKVLIPSMGKSMFFEESHFPKLMIEINGKTMLEHVIANFSGLREKRFIFVYSADDCMRFHLDDSTKIITDNNADILMLKNDTAGALCTCLMAVDYIDDDEPLIIANSDQIIDVDYGAVLEYFEEQGNDAGVIIFDSIHPRWSYIKLDGDEVVETAEKRPLSKNAIAGFYYFRKGSYFVEAAKKVILKDTRLDGKFYISSSLNELILLGKSIGYYRVSAEKYSSFYSPDKIREYEIAASRLTD